jgi:ElaB/YqjD/DUF883 family membrane-anchored ribosome-binding protein
MSAPLGTAIAGNGAGRARNAVPTPFDELFDGVDDLIKRVADVESPEIRKIRAKVHAALVVAKSALKDSATQVRSQAVPVAGGTDEYLNHDPGQFLSHDPGQSLGLALLVGVGLGLVVSLDNDYGS